MPPTFRGRKVAAPLKRAGDRRRCQRRSRLPRPKGRGPIEAGRFVGRRGGLCAFRGRKVAAPLKLGGGLRVGRRKRPFRGRKVAAPLKPCLTRSALLAGIAFRGRKVAAPLKHFRSGAMGAGAMTLPRPKGRGPIEA